MAAVAGALSLRVEEHSSRSLCRDVDRALRVERPRERRDLVHAGDGVGGRALPRHRRGARAAPWRARRGAGRHRHAGAAVGDRRPLRVAPRAWPIRAQRVRRSAALAVLLGGVITLVGATADARRFRVETDALGARDRRLCERGGRRFLGVARALRRDRICGDCAGAGVHRPALLKRGLAHVRVHRLDFSRRSKRFRAWRLVLREAPAWDGRLVVVFALAHSRGAHGRRGLACASQQRRVHGIALQSRVGGAERADRGSCSCGSSSRAARR